LDLSQDLSPLVACGKTLKKARRDGLIQVAAKHADWVPGFLDEDWWNPEFKGIKNADALFSTTSPRGYKVIDHTKEDAKRTD
jgi:hypothetical protein